ncbi:MAG: acetyl-CoA carboxylase biotin carboxyl carrier protein subunit [Bacteroidales bacterium]|nr:acetyl-CoA carboxylase biotin carboxyl carrier protein subunit [Bacteroidales bacterium]MBN2698198.1 acetyl-CoA carboxylase biotin carboxyl carrier protein subunit [Bacteroidales bacterium]
MKSEKQDIPERESRDFQYLDIDGTRYLTQFNAKFPPAKRWSRPDKKNVNAFIPGTIQKVMVEPGNQVQAGDTLVILEAMKMRNRISAQESGVVKVVNVREGDQIPKGFLIMEFE